MFNVHDCAIPEIWCGKGPPKKRGSKWYYKTGSRYDCLKKGFGAGSAKERRKNLPENSLQQIRYVGDVYERRFKQSRVATLDQLIREAQSRSKSNLQTFLKRIFTRRKGGLDKRAYNYTILFLYRHGIGHVPSCIRITP